MFVKLPLTVAFASVVLSVVVISVSPVNVILTIFAVAEFEVKFFNSASFILIELLAVIVESPTTVNLPVTSISFELFVKLPLTVAFASVVLSVVVISVSPVNVILTIFAVAEFEVKFFNSASFILIELLAVIVESPATVNLPVTSISFELFVKLPLTVAFASVVLSVVVIFVSSATTILTIFAVAEFEVKFFNSASFILIELLAVIVESPTTVNLPVTSVSLELFVKLPPIVAFAIVVLSVVEIFVSSATTILTIFAVVDVESKSLFKVALSTMSEFDSFVILPVMVALLILLVLSEFTVILVASIFPVNTESLPLFIINEFPTTTLFIVNDILSAVEISESLPTLADKIFKLLFTPFIYAFCAE